MLDLLKLSAWDDSLRTSRVIYHKIHLSPEMAVPWWTLDPDSDLYVPKTPKLHRQASSRLNVRRLARVQNVHDPLRSRSPTPTSYEQTEADVELLQSIVLDIHRLFPGDAFFHGKGALHTQRHLVTVLYVWAKCNPHVGYKQGMHEMFGLVYMNLAAESMEIASTNTFSSDDLRILSLYDSHYLAHDLFAIMSRFLVGVVPHFYQSEQALMKSIEYFNSILMKTDQLIHYNLVTKLRVESSLWVIRYMRLLLVRELGNDLLVASLLWDKLAAAQAVESASIACIPELVSCIIVVMLVHVKTDLVVCDFAEALSLLLHYPTETKLGEKKWAEHVFADAYVLYENRHNDLKLYECGLKLNKRYNAGIRIRIGPDRSATSSPKVSGEVPTAQDTRAATMAFEKMRLEMRLKKTARRALNP